MQTRTVGRLVHLLDPVSVAEANPLGGLGDDSSLRTRDEDRWEAVVNELVEVIPAIVLDTRVASRGVRHESQRLLAPRFRGRTVFVVDKSGRSRLLESLVDGALRAELLTTDAEHCAVVVRDLLRHRGV